MKKNIFTFVCASFATIASLNAMITPKQAHFCITNQLQSIAEPCTFPLVQTPSPHYFAMVKNAERENELCVPKGSLLFITTPKKAQSIISTTDFKNGIALALLTKRHNNTWFAAMGNCPINVFEKYQDLFILMLERSLINQQEFIKLIKFIIVYNENTTEKNCLLFFNNLVHDRANIIQKPLEVWSFDYNEKNAIAFSKETPKDFEIYLNADNTGFVYLNTTNDYVELS